MEDTVTIEVKNDGDIVERYSVQSNPVFPVAFSAYKSGIYEIEGFSTTVEFDHLNSKRPA